MYPEPRDWRYSSSVNALLGSISDSRNIDLRVESWETVPVNLLITPRALKDIPATMRILKMCCCCLVIILLLCSSLCHHQLQTQQYLQQSWLPFIGQQNVDNSFMAFYHIMLIFYWTIYVIRTIIFQLSFIYIYCLVMIWSDGWKCLYLVFQFVDNKTERVEMGIIIDGCLLCLSGILLVIVNKFG